ncbi:MAG: hypothetical protein KIS79_00490 [Burkholderiales bacterium]|nr:hypothetical protein [Burkholderiales bacterium]
MKALLLLALAITAGQCAAQTPDLGKILGLDWTTPTLDKSDPALWWGVEVNPSELQKYSDQLPFLILQKLPIKKEDDTYSFLTDTEELEFSDKIGQCLRSQSPNACTIRVTGQRTQLVQQRRKEWEREQRREKKPTTLEEYASSMRALIAKPVWHPERKRLEKEFREDIERKVKQQMNADRRSFKERAQECFGQQEMLRVEVELQTTFATMLNAYKKEAQQIDERYAEGRLENPKANTGGRTPEHAEAVRRHRELYFQRMEDIAKAVSSFRMLESIAREKINEVGDQYIACRATIEACLE